MSSETIQPNIATEPGARQPLNMSNLLIWAGVFAIIGLLGWGLIKRNEVRPEAGEMAPTFEMQFFDGYDWNGQPAVSLEEMQGNIVVLNFWASWCVECRIEAEELEASWRQYKDQGVIFLGVAHVDVEPKSLAYLREFGITYPNAPDLGTIISEEYDITGVPETFIIDQNGEIVDVTLGPIPAARLNGIIEQLIAEGG